VLCVLLIWAWAPPVEASGFSLGRFGGIYGHSNASGGLALYWNAARIGSGEAGAFLMIDASLVLRRASYDRVVLDSNPLAGAPGVQEWNTGEATTSTTAVLPMLSLGGAHDVSGSRLGWAVGVYPAYGGSVVWDKALDADSQYPGAVDGPQRWSAISSAFLVLQPTVGLSWRFGDSGVSVGATVSYVDGHLESSRARNLSREEGLVFDDGAIQEGRVWLRTNDSGWSGTLAISVERDAWIWSAQYRSGYELRMDGVLRQAFATQTPSDVASHVDANFPHILQTSFTAMIRDVELTGSLDFSRWSTLRSTDLYSNASPAELLLYTPRFARDTLSARIFVGWQMSPRLQLAGQVGVDPSAIPERANEPGLSDALKFPVGGGLHWNASDTWDLRLSYVRDFYVPVEVRNSVHEPPSNGRYEDARRFLTLSVEARI
jgi:long-subunit fatty acid transport protein